MKKTKANQFYKHLDDNERSLMIEEASVHYRNFLHTLGIDTETDPDSKDTPHRVARMMVNEVIASRYQKLDETKLTQFDNDVRYTDLLFVGPVEVKSMCAHHMLPFMGKAYLGILYGAQAKMIGLSKFARIVEYFSRKPQSQEALTNEILDFIEKQFNPEGCGLLIDSKHTCMSHRGINSDADMVTCIVRGSMLEQPSIKQEFIQYVAMKRK